MSAVPSVENNGRESITHQRMLKSAVIITAFLITAQGITALTQILMGAIFGSGSEMDAYLSGNTLPQYFISVLIAALSFVFLPIFVDYSAVGKVEEAWQIASRVINLTILVLGALALAGIIFAERLLRLTVPGLSQDTIILATGVARIAWPTIPAIGLVSLLTGIYHAQSRFRWAAIVPVLGNLLTFGLTWLLAYPLGVKGLAVAATSGVVVQAILLLPICRGKNRYQLVFDLNNPGLHRIIQLIWPLVISGILIRATPIIDRYLASELPEGSISYLGYANNLVRLIIVVISSGLAAVIFPRMATNTATGDISGLRLTVSFGSRAMWLLIAPALTLGIVLALPIVIVVFQRGNFTYVDSRIVAGLSRIYLFSIIGLCLGTISGRALYALKETRIFASISIMEVILYFIYDVFLVKKFGVYGAAIAFSIYCTFSLLWQLIILRKKTGNTSGRRVLKSSGLTLTAAVAGGVIAWFTMQIIHHPYLQFIFGGGLGFLAYCLALLVLGSEEAWTVYNIILQRFKPTH